MKIVIRACQVPDDLAALTQLLHRAYAELAARGLRYGATHQTPDETEKLVLAGHCFVAEVNRALVGTITVRGPNQESKVSTYREPATFVLGRFGVDPLFRGQGVGRQLHAHAVRFAEERGARAIALDTAVPAQHLIDLYLRWGYCEVGRCHWETTNYESVIMRRELDGQHRG